jgi:uncharacterized protein YaaQ
VETLRLVVAVVDRRAAPDLVQALTREGFRVTRLASTGGFLQRGSTTLLIGVEEARLEPLLERLRQVGQNLPTASGSQGVPRLGVAFVLRVHASDRL